MRAVATRGFPMGHAELLRQPFRPSSSSPHARLLSDERVIHISDVRTEPWEYDDPKLTSAIEIGVRTCSSCLCARTAFYWAGLALTEWRCVRSPTSRLHCSRTLLRKQS